MLNLSRHPTTLYQAIAAQLEEELRNRYRCGEYLPSEKQLAANYAVNRHTLRRAVDELVDKGLVQRRQGVGILVLMRITTRCMLRRASARTCWSRAATRPASACWRCCARAMRKSPVRWRVKRAIRLSTCARCAGSTACRSA